MERYHNQTVRGFSFLVLSYMVTFPECLQDHVARTLYNVCTYISLIRGLARRLDLYPLPWTSNWVAWPWMTMACLRECARNRLSWHPMACSCQRHCLAMVIAMALYIARRIQGPWHIPWLSKDRPWRFEDGPWIVHDMPWHGHDIIRAMPLHVPWPV